MGKRLYVGNLSFNTTEEGLRAAFSEGGRNVTHVSIITDRETGRSRGFGFVTPEDGGQDVFLHSSVLQRAGKQDVQQGEKVALEVRDGQRGRQAVNMKD